MARDLEPVTGVVLDVIPAAPSGQEDTATCNILLAGVVENAFQIEVVSIEKRHVVLRIRMGDDHDREYRLGKHERFVGNLNLRSQSVGVAAMRER